MMTFDGLPRTGDEEVDDLLARIVEHPNLKLVIYRPDNWAVENAYGPGALSFDPVRCLDDPFYLIRELQRIIDGGRA